MLDIKFPKLENFLDLEKPITHVASRKVASVSEWDRVKGLIDTFVSSDKKFYRRIEGKHIEIPVRYRRLAVTGEGKEIKGVVTVSDVLDFLGAGPKHKLFGIKHGLDATVENIMSQFVYTIDKDHSIGRSLHLFRRFRHGAYPVLDGLKLHSIVSESDLIKTVNRPLGLRVKDIMVRKPHYAKADFTITDVAKMMCKGGFRRLPVVDKKVLVGIVTPFDILAYLHRTNKLGELKNAENPVWYVMNKNPITIGPEEDVYDAISIMREYNLGGLPVTRFEDLVGIITERDILDVLI